MPPWGEGDSSAGPLSSKVECDPFRTHRKDWAPLPAEVESARTERRIGKCWEATRAPTQWPRPIQGDAAPSPLSSVCRHRARIGRGTKAQNPGGAGAKPLRHSLLPLRKPASSHNARIALLATTQSPIRPKHIGPGLTEIIDQLQSSPP